LLWELADRLVYAKVREAFGGRVRIFVSGGAPLGLETAKWFAAMGIALWEGYGLTETSPVIALNTPLSQRMGAAGRPLPNLELKLAEDGELLVRGPSVFTGYWRRHRPPGRRWLPVHHRPQEGAAEDLGRQDGGAATD
jgi:long-chain acyl-CoA synthetase